MPTYEYNGRRYNIPENREMDFLKDVPTAKRISYIERNTGVSDLNIIKIFEEQVMENPNNVALICSGREMTYLELNRKANQLANYLIQHYQIKADDLIVLNIGRMEYMIISILAVLKAGGAYVPMNPDYPEERIAYVAKDTKCKVILSTSEHTSMMNLEMFECDILSRVSSCTFQI